MSGAMTERISSYTRATGVSVAACSVTIGIAPIVPVESQTTANLFNCPQVLSRTARRCQRWSPDLNQAIGVGVTAPFLGMRGGWRITSARIAVSVGKMSCTTRCLSLASAARA